MAIPLKPWESVTPGPVWWTNIREDNHYIMQEHKNPNVGMLGGYGAYRIITQEGTLLAASANTRTEIETNWGQLHADKYTK